MQVHVSTHRNHTAVLFLDGRERIAVLPTDFINALSRSPRNYANGTLTTYADKLKDFLKMLEVDEAYPMDFSIDDRIRSLDLTAIDGYLRAIQKLGKSPSTVRLADVAIKRFTDWLVTDEAGRVRDAPLYRDGKYRTPTPPRRMPKYLTVPEVIRLISGLRFEYQRLAVHLAFDIGARVSELPRVFYSDLPKVEHYPQTQNYFPILIRGSKARGKPIKERYSIISRPVLVRLSRYHRSKRYLSHADLSSQTQHALLNFDGRPLTAKAIQKFTSRAKHNASMARAHPHMLRHGTAFSILKSEHGKTYLDNLLILQKVLGHADIGTTEIYTHIPAPILERVKNFEGKLEMRFRFEEAQKIFDETYLRRRDEPSGAF